MLRKQQHHAPALAAASDRCGEAVAAARRASKCFDDSFQSQSICLARLEAVLRRWRCGSSDSRPGARRARRVGRRSASSRSSRTPATSTGHTRTRRATTCSRAAASRISSSTSSWPRGSAPGCSGLGALTPSEPPRTRRAYSAPFARAYPRRLPTPAGASIPEAVALGWLLQDGVKVKDAAAAAGASAGPAVRWVRSWGLRSAASRRSRGRLSPCATASRGASARRRRARARARSFPRFGRRPTWPTLWSRFCRRTPSGACPWSRGRSATRSRASSSRRRGSEVSLGSSPSRASRRCEARSAT